MQQISRRAAAIPPRTEDEMTVRLHSKISLGWDGEPEVFEYKCKWVKVIGKKIEICISDNYKVLWTTDRCDLEIAD